MKEPSQRPFRQFRREAMPRVGGGLLPIGARVFNGGVSGMNADQRSSFGTPSGADGGER